MANTTLGFPYPAATDPPAGHTQIQALAAAVDLQPGIGAFTQAQITAFTAGEKRAGRIVWNSTTSTLQRCDGSAFVDVVLASGAQTLAGKTLTTPTIADLTNAAHNHSNAAGGGNIPESSVTNLVADLAAKAATAPVINAQVGTTYTLLTSDLGKTVTCSNASPVTVTLDTSLSGLATGAILTVVNVGAGLVTIAASGTTISGSPLTLAQYKGASLLKTGTNAYVMLPFSGSSAAVATGGTESTLTNPDGDGKNYRLHTFTANGNLVVTVAGWIRVLIAGSGGKGYTNGTQAAGGGGGGFFDGWMWAPVGTLPVVIGAAQATAATDGNLSSFNGEIRGGGGGGRNGVGTNVLPPGGGGSGGGVGVSGTADGAGAGGTLYGGANSKAGRASTITGASVTYCAGASFGDSAPAANQGHGSGSGFSSSAGVVYIRREI